MVAATSSAPSAEPCAAPVFCLFGAGQAMIVLSAMNDGALGVLPGVQQRAVERPGVFVIAARLADTSTCCTCQP